MEYMPMALSKLIKEKKRKSLQFSEFEIKIYSYQLFRSLAYLNGLGICHRDIKPQNILINQADHSLKLCDFGSAKQIIKNQSNTIYISSRHYRAPELIFGNSQYTNSIDMWSAGCVIIEMIIGQPIFPGDSQLNQIIEIIKILGTPTLQQIKQINPNINEFNFPQLKSQPWHIVFQNFNINNIEIIDLISKILVYAPNERLSPLQALSHNYFDQLRTKEFNSLHKEIPDLFNFTKGTDSRLLTSFQREELLKFVNQDQKGQSFLVYNSNEAQRKLKTWQEQLPWIRPFYALKSNPIAPLVRDLTSNGAGLDVASQGEIRQGLDMGLNPKDMIYSNPVKEENDIIYAQKNNVLYTTADSFDEIKKISQLAPKIKILWRISIPEDNSKQLATVFSNKFGDDIFSIEDAKQKFKYIIQDLGINLHGIHFHCGSGKNGSTSFLKAVHMARKCIEIGRQYGHSMEILDLGGGYPAGELNQNVIEALKITKDDPLGYRVIAEPGRHFSQYTCYLFTRILAKRMKQGRLCFHLNDSLYHSFNCILMDGITFENQKDQFYKQVDNQSNQQVDIQDSDMTEGSLFGMTCDGLDVIAKNMSLPQNIQVGDWLCFSGMGSYTYGPKSKFNGMESTTRIFQWDSQINFKKDNFKQYNNNEEFPLIWNHSLIVEPSI